MSAITDNISGRHSIERGRFRAVLLPKQVQAKTISGGPSTGKKGILSYQYSAQNHDWDLTPHAAADLIKAGLVADRQPKTGSLSMGFSYFTGGMVLCFAAIESFSASVAFSMQSDARFSSFDFQRYRSTGRFWDKMGMLMSAAAIEIDRGQGLFQHIGQMQVWRNLVTHASPYGIEPTEIDNTVEAPGVLHAKKRHLEYTRMADPEHARKFYETAVAFIELVIKQTGLDPRASATYQILE